MWAAARWRNASRPSVSGGPQAASYYSFRQEGEGLAHFMGVAVGAAEGGRARIARRGAGFVATLQGRRRCRAARPLPPGSQAAEQVPSGGLLLALDIVILRDLLIFTAKFATMGLRTLLHYPCSPTGFGPPSTQTL